MVVSFKDFKIARFNAKVPLIVLKILEVTFASVCALRKEFPMGADGA